MKPGKFITLEGIDGCGKSTTLAHIQAALTNAGKPVLITRQPGGTGAGEAIREVLKHSNAPISPISEVLLFAASFHQSWEEILEPALRNGTWVVSDRFTDSTRAYQCGGRGLPDQPVEDILSAACPTQPDLTLLFDLSPETAAARANNDPHRRTVQSDRFESEGLELQRRVREKYLALSKFSKRFQIIDTERLNKKETAEAAIHAIEDLL